MVITADKFISEKEQEKLFKAMDKLIGTDQRVIIEYTLYKLLSLTGLRISEALHLEWSDILEGSIIIRAEHSKSGKRASVTLGKAAIQLLETFRQHNPYKDSPYLFNTRKGRYKRSNAHERLKYYLSVAGLRDSISCHCFRHGWAVKALDKGISLGMVRDNLRHSNISVTSTYIHHTQDSLNKLRDAF